MVSRTPTGQGAVAVGSQQEWFSTTPTSRKRISQASGLPTTASASGEATLTCCRARVAVWRTALGEHVCPFREKFADNARVAVRQTAVGEIVCPFRKKLTVRQTALGENVCPFREKLTVENKRSQLGDVRSLGLRAQRKHPLGLTT